MGAEQANLRAAVSFAASTGHAGHATLIAAAMAEFLYVQGRWQDGIALHQTAVAAADAAGDRAGHARALGPLMHMQISTGDFGAARPNTARAPGLLSLFGDRAGEAEMHQAIAFVDAIAGRYPAALAGSEEVLRMFRDLGDVRGEAGALRDIGSLRWLTADYRGAACLEQQALDLFRAATRPASSTR